MRSQRIFLIGLVFLLLALGSGNVSMPRTASAAFPGGNGKIAFSSSQASATFDSSLKGYWKFDETSGTTAVDSSGNGYDGTLFNGATFSTSGRFGGAVQLDDASNQYVSIGDQTGLAITGDLTIIAWIYPTSFAGEGHIVARRAAGCGAMGYQLFHTENGQIGVDSGAAPPNDSLALSSLTLNLNAWNFVGVTHDGGTNQWSFNVNGTTATGMGGALGTGAGTVLIGQANGCPGVNAVQGRIDEVKIFNRKLSPAELVGEFCVARVCSSATNATAGGTISDTATLAGGTNPTGTINFSVFGPNDPSCSGTPTSGGSATVTGNGAYNSSAVTENVAGAYRWIASYSGDANNNAFSTPCNDSGETSTVSPVGGGGGGGVGGIAEAVDPAVLPSSTAAASGNDRMAYRLAGVAGVLAAVAGAGALWRRRRVR